MCWKRKNGDPAQGGHGNARRLHGIDLLMGQRFGHWSINEPVLWQVLVFSGDMSPTFRPPILVLTFDIPLFADLQAQLCGNTDYYYYGGVMVLISRSDLSFFA